MGVRISSFPQDGRLWRLDWVGRIHGRSGVRQTPMVDVQLTPVSWEGLRWRNDQRAYDHSASLILAVSINLWPLLRIATFWKDGERVYGDAGDIIDVTADVTSETQLLSRAFDRLDGGRVLIPPFEHRLVEAMASTRVVRIRMEDELAELILPCSEIFRAYYGQSSRLAYHLLTGAFVGDSYNQIYDPVESWIRDDECSARLGYRIRNSDALVISRLAFDPVANRNAKRIVTDTITSGAAGEPFALTCYPPFEATTDLQVRGRYLDGGARFLVYEIKRCTAPFPASTVRADRPQKKHGSPASTRPLMKTVAVGEIIMVDESSDPTSDILPEEIDVVATPIFAAAAAPSVGEEADATRAVVPGGGASALSLGEERGNVNAPIELVPGNEEDDELFVLDGRSATIMLDQRTLSGRLHIRKGSMHRIVVDTGAGLVPVELASVRSIQIVGDAERHEPRPSGE